MRRASVAVAAALLVAAASGCGDRGASAPVARTGVKWLDESHEPVKVALVLDTTNRVTRTVDSSGATITATGGDGTFFTLEIPPGALHRRERISVIPVKSVQGLPLEKGGAVGTVQLEPEGLRFDRPVKLTIEAEKPVTASELVAFAWIADGRDTHLFPAKGDSLDVQFSLLHFSGYGFGKAPANDPGRSHLANAAAIEARLEAKVAEIISAERRAILIGEKTGEDGGELWAKVMPYLLEYFDAVIMPTLKIAETDDRMAACALQFYLGWKRNMELLGYLGEDTHAAARNGDVVAQRTERGDESMWRIIANVEATVLKRAQDGCRKHDLRAYNRVLSVSRTVILLGAEGKQTEKNLEAAFGRAEEECLRYELELVSDVQSQLESGSSRFQLASRPTFGPKAEENEAALNYQALEISGRPWKDVLDAMSGGGGAALLQKGSFLRAMDYTMSKRGSRHGTVRIAGIEPVWVKHDTVGTTCTGTDEKEKDEQADTMLVTLRIEPPTEIVRFTPMVGGAPHDADMHEWMRFFTQFRQYAGNEVASASGKGSDDTPEEQEQAQILVVKVVRQEPGLWRAEFNTKEGALGGSKGLSETGHLVLRHTPK